MTYAVIDNKPLGTASLNLGQLFKVIRLFTGWSAPKRFANQSHLADRIWRRHSALICASSNRYRFR